VKRDIVLGYISEEQATQAYGADCMAKFFP
jgi:hypothetical protein